MVFESPGSGDDIIAEGEESGIWSGASVEEDAFVVVLVALLLLTLVVAVSLVVVVFKDVSRVEEEFPFDALVWLLLLCTAGSGST